MASRPTKKQKLLHKQSSMLDMTLDEEDVQAQEQGKKQEKEDENVAAPPALVRADSTVWVHMKTAPITSKYRMGKKVGEGGAFGYAREVECLKTGEVRACKVISKQRLIKQASYSVQAANLKALKNEIAILEQLQHPSIVNFHEAFETPEDLFLVFEYCRGGELFDRIIAKERYSEQDAWRVARELFQGLAYLHKQGIAHMDLKPENLMFASKDDDAQLKIIDFGLSRFMRSRGDSHGKYFQQYRGTLAYASPEMLAGRFDHSADMWSIGVILFVMLFGYPPFNGDGPSRLEAAICKGFTPEVRPGYGAWFPKAIPVSAAAKDLISSLLTTNWAERITARECLAHEWLQQAEGDVSDTPLPPAVVKGLREFEQVNDFEQAVLEHLARDVPQAELLKLRQTFGEIDKDGDGVVTVDELRSVLGMDSEHILRSVDVDGDGKMNFQELLLVCVRRKLMAKEERLWRAFRRFDTDEDGFISCEELQRALGQEHEEAKALIEQVDDDGDGKISYQEFLDRFMQQEEENSQIFEQDWGEAAEGDRSDREDEGVDV